MPKTYIVIAHEDGFPTQVMTPDGQTGILFPRASDDGKNIFFGLPEVKKAVFRRMPDGKEEFIIGGMTVEEVRDQIYSKEGFNWKPGCEDWDLVERMTVTFW